MAFDPTIHIQAMEHIRDTLQGLSAEFLHPLRITKDEVRIRKKPWTKDRIYPGVTIHPEKEELGLGTCSTDDIGYGCVVSYIRRGGMHVEDDNLDRVIRFRSEVRSRFFRQPWPIDCIYTCGVEPAVLLLPREFENHYEISSLLLRPWSEEERQ